MPDTISLQIKFATWIEDLQRSLMPLVILMLVAPMLLILACSDGDDVEVIGNGTDSVTGEPAAPGVVEAKPGDAVQVDATLSEWAITMGSSSVRSGKVYFLVRNLGPEDPHEFVIIKSDRSPTDLPTEHDRVPEDDVDIIDEIPPYLPNSSASIVVDLKPGKYVLICNILENQEGEVESHYKKGMTAALTVQ